MARQSMDFSFGGPRGSAPDTSSIQNSPSTGSTDVTTSFLAQFDFSSIESLDPSLAHDDTAVYDREIAFELRMQDAGSAPPEVGSLEPIRAKILVQVRGTPPTISPLLVADAWRASERTPG
eukprot:GHVT01004962.1.p3 GENE.GHVT01004962.1~~GHVT01004962.1.p3  ORF type:complete len:121 (-),score=3.83 GHVT01004962.1:3359-3721(-)